MNELETVFENIKAVEAQLAQDMPKHYIIFAKPHKWDHLCEIRTKALAYWKRRFNRTLLKLGYKL
jgi:hypothetical protein